MYDNAGGDAIWQPNIRYHVTANLGVTDWTKYVIDTGEWTSAIAQSKNIIMFVYPGKNVIGASGYAYCTNRVKGIYAFNGGNSLYLRRTIYRATSDYYRSVNGRVIGDYHPGGNGIGFLGGGGGGRGCTFGDCTVGQPGSGAGYCPSGQSGCAPRSDLYPDEVEGYYWGRVGGSYSWCAGRACFSAGNAGGGGFGNAGTTQGSGDSPCYSSPASSPGAGATGGKTGVVAANVAYQLLTI
jgi:hypothetical protein